MIKRRRELAIGIAVLLGSTVSALGSEQIAMPFQCKLERGRVQLTASSERTYDVLGARRKQPFMFCLGPQGRSCRMRTLHNFDIACGGGKTSWMSVAAAAARLKGTDVRIEGGQLHVGFSGAGRTTACAEAEPRGSVRAAVHDPAAERSCLARRADAASQRIMRLPPGFAPLEEVGARLVSASARAPSAEPAPAPPISANIAASPTDGSVPRIIFDGPPDPPEPAAVIFADKPVEPEALSEEPLTVALPMPINTTADSETEPQAAPVSRPGTTLAEIAEIASRALPAPWLTTTATDAPDAPGEVSLFSAVWSGLAWEERWITTSALLTAMLLGAVLIVRRRQTVARANAAKPASSSLVNVVRTQGLLVPEERDEHMLQQLCVTADTLLSNAHLLLEDLRSAPPLRGVLRQELDVIHLRLTEVNRAPAEPPTPKQMRQRLQGGIRELHRVVKIAEGARDSFASGAPRPKLPGSREEAYDLLGVNDSISEATLKKVVDALRLSWHPDYATDEDDRQRREERTKQINVAWDLITGRRATA